MRVVLYVEGAGESFVRFSTPRARLSPDELGPAHQLVRRALASARKAPEEAIAFYAGLRLDRGRRRPKGSDLLVAKNLCHLFTFVPTTRPSEKLPELAIAVVDSDGELDRLDLLESATANATFPHVIGVAVQEFESWLIADAGALTSVIGKQTTQPPNVETLAPREAKDLLTKWIGENDSASAAKVRASLASQCDLELLRRQCRSFARFHDSLASIQLG